MVGECSQDAWRTKAWRGLAKFFMLGSQLQATAVEFVIQEKVFPPDPGPRYFTKITIAKGAGVARFAAPENYYLLANPRLAEAPNQAYQCYAQVKDRSDVKSTTY